MEEGLGLDEAVSASRRSILDRNGGAPLMQFNWNNGLGPLLLGFISGLWTATLFFVWIIWEKL
jgi:hypothetical protein